jgi:hypothetical protein
LSEGVPGRKLACRIERLVGARVESDGRVEGGYTPALRLLCRTAGGSFFAKVGTTPGMCQSLRREIHVCNRLRGDNICLRAGRAVYVDWNGARLSNPELDHGFLPAEPGRRERA